MNDFHEADLKRVRENDEWVRAFYWKGGRKHDDSIKCLTDALKWRQEIGVNSKFIKRNFIIDN